MAALSLSSSSFCPSNSTSPESSSSSVPFKRKTLDSSSSLPRTTLLLPDGSQVNLLEPSPFEPLIKGARWPDSHLEILKAAFDPKQDSIPSSLRRPLALYLAVPSTRITNWLHSRRGKKKRDPSGKDSSMSAGVGVGAVGASKVEELRGLKKSSVEVEKDEGSTTEEEEEEELVQRAVKKRREESGSGGVKDGESKDQGVECEEVKSSSPTKSDAYIPPSSSAANPSFSPRTTPTSHSLDELHTEIEPEPESEVEPDPSKPAFLDKLAILSLFQTGPLLPPTSSSSLAELDLLSFDQPSDPLQQPGSSVLSTHAHPVGRPPLSDLSLASLLLARTTDHPASSSSSCPFSSSPSSSSSNMKMSEPSQNSSPNSHSSFEHPSPQDDLKRKAPSTPLPSQPPSKIIKISPPKPNGPGSKMDHEWLGFLTSGWFGDGWRWRKKNEEDNPSSSCHSSRDDGSADVEMEDASSNSSSNERSS